MWPSTNNSSGTPSSSSQWSFNPAVYQNIPYEQVDWASLAQQWIKMKETTPSVRQGPLPPPAPQISKSSSAASTPTVVENQNDIEGGEAPMDMDTKEDETPSGPVGVTSTGNWNQWRSWQSQWGWGWPGNAGTVPLADNSQSTPSTVDRKDYWSDSLSAGSDKVVPEAWMKGNKLSNRHPQKPVLADQFPVIVIGRERKKKKKQKQRVPKQSTSNKHCLCRHKLIKDAAKKKQLPAWIREGLNKMEREKQKKLERERIMQEKIMRDQMKSEELLQEISQENIQSFKMPVSNEEHARKSPPPSFNSRNHQKKFSPITPAEHERQRPLRTNKEDSSSIRKTKDQMMEASMLKVRRILTEILLESTENLVHIIAKEEYRRAKSSASAQQIRKSNALSSLTGNLGLGVYESESESSDSERERDDRRGDSDEELKILIDRKRRDFQKIEDIIEQEIEDREAKERLIARQEYDSDNNNDVNDEKEDIRTNYEPIRYSQEPTKNSKGTVERIAPSYHDGFDELHHRDEVRPSVFQKSYSHGEKVNGNKIDKSKPRNVEKTKTKSSSSSSSSTSTSSESSTHSSSVSSSSSSSDSSDAESERSSSRKKKRKPKSKIKEKTSTESKHKRYRSRSRSTSRSRYSRSDKYGDSRNRTPESSDRRRSSPHRRRSPSYRRRSSSYHRESREMSRSRYRESTRRRDSDSKRRRRSSSTESRHSRYKRR